LGVDIENVKTVRSLFAEKDSCRKAVEYIKLSSSLAQKEHPLAPEQLLIRDYYGAVHKQLENINDRRLKNLNNYSATIERIIVTMKTGKRLKIEELKVILDNISCIIAEPDLISKYFPMEEDSIDVLIIDEASQVSIAESISLILRAKKIVVFGDELQYGAVSAGNVSEKYARQYFKEILNSYASDYKIAIDEREKEKLSAEASCNVDEEEGGIEPIYKPEEGTKEWLKTFSIRTSTLSFAKAIKNYGTSLDTHFRSFPEIIGYSNEFFYKISQIPLVINRIRTKPIGEVLRFTKVETQGNSGSNVNLDEIEAIKQDIQSIMANGFKGTIGIITSFREQRTKMEEVLRKELSNYHFLEKDNKLTIWFVGDVQGEERDIVYYSFVQDKKINNADLRMIYPTIGGTADDIRKLKMQRLNVGFSRAKDIMVFVHSMPIEEYSNTRLGDALKFYAHLLESTTDNYIKDEAIFGSPAEKDLYSLIGQTDFYNKNRDKIKIIAQFPIGEYVEETLHKYIPKYRVDFLLTVSDKGREQSLILEYDGVEYHTKNPEIVTAHNFSQEYLDYDIERQLELESYGYRFLRINKFTLTPKEKNETRIDVLNALLKKKFEQ
jgi:superfamily I DNA and/or RNA helicase